MRAAMTKHTRPIWAEISSSRLSENYRALRAAAGGAMDVLAVVKANAYGHDVLQCAPVLANAGATWLGVTSVEEGVAVRQVLGLRDTRVLVMCSLWAGEEAAVFDHRLTPVVWEHVQLDLLEAEANRRGMAAGSVAVHLEIDTGMARQGVAPGWLLDALLARFKSSSPLRLEGVMTHLASTEVADDPQNTLQMRAFGAALAQVARAGLQPMLVHAGNTSSVDSGFVPQMLPALAQSIGACAMTRTGLALYGHALTLEMQHGRAQPHLSPALQPVLTWKTRIVGLRDVPAGATVGYNATYVADRPTRLALLPVGYADGFRRALSSSTHQRGGDVLLRGQRAPIVGRVSMDLTVVDVTHIPQTAIGDEVVLMGHNKDEFIGADEHARIAGTSAYEVLCGISDRVPRVVLD